MSATRPNCSEFLWNFRWQSCHERAAPLCSPRSAVSKKRARHADVRMWNGWNGWPSRWKAGDRSNVRKPAKLHTY